MLFSIPDSLLPATSPETLSTPPGGRNQTSAAVSRANSPHQQAQPADHPRDSPLETPPRPQIIAQKRHWPIACGFVENRLDRCRLCSAPRAAPGPRQSPAASALPFAPTAQRAPASVARSAPPSAAKLPASASPRHWPCPQRVRPGCRASSARAVLRAWPGSPPEPSPAPPAIWIKPLSSVQSPNL